MQRIISDMAVIDLTPEGLMLRELAPGVSIEDVRAATQPRLHVPLDPKVMQLRASA
ncbi:MAG: hypothetical protein NVS9B12_09470 [Vulcanimicrobiaceae bacterium]